MANPSVEEILNMKSYQLKEFLEDHHVPVPKRQSKEFLQTVALQAHADIEAESSKRRIITRRRSKREETDLGSTYSGIYGRSSSMPRSSASHNSPPQSLMTTRSRSLATYVKMEAESPDAWKQERVRKEQAAIEPAQDRLHDDKEEGISYSSYSAMLHATGTPAAAPAAAHILSSTDINQQVDNAGEKEAAGPSSKRDHGDGSRHEISAEVHSGKDDAMRVHQEGSVDTAAVPQMERGKEGMKAVDNEGNIKKQSRPNQEVVKKIIRVNDEGDMHQANSYWIKKPSSSSLYKKGHAKGHQYVNASDQVSRMQRLKRSASMMMSQVNERVFKRLRRGVPTLQPSALHVRTVALLMCAAMCVTAIGVASYWYHLKKLEEQRARKRWLW